MDINQPWDGRDYSDSNPRPIHRVVLNQEKPFRKNSKKHSSIDSVNVTDCFSADLFEKGKHKPVTAKVPVVVAMPQIEITLESFVKLQEPAIEIKRIRKSVELTQCDILPSFYRDKKQIYKIFLSGFVRKNIEYATATNSYQQKTSGNIQHTTVNVPFNCTTELQLEKGASLSLQFQQPNPIAELEFLDPCDKLSSDQDLSGNINSQLLNEKPYCELVKTSVVELDTILDGRPFTKGHTEKTFRCIKEKMVVLIQLKVLQEQQVLISKSKEKKKEKEKDKDKDKDKHKEKRKRKHKHKEKRKRKHKIEVEVDVKVKEKDIKDDSKHDEKDKDEEDDKKGICKDKKVDLPKKKINLKDIIDKSTE